MFFRLHRSRAALLPWLAALALVLLPTFSRAVAPVDAAPFWTQLCGGGDAGTMHATLDACGHCGLAATPVLPASVPAAIPGLQAAPVLVTTACQAGALQEVPGSAWPRAPPPGPV